MPTGTDIEGEKEEKISGSSGMLLDKRKRKGKGPFPMEGR